MKKKSKINVFSALAFELLFIPVLSCISYFIYNTISNYMVINNIIVSILVIVILIVVNLLLIYYLTYLLNRRYKFDLEYQIVLGGVIIFIMLWIKLYFNTLEETTCSGGYLAECVRAIKYNKTFTYSLIFLVSYNLLYIPMHFITKGKRK